jgi:ABC-type multidrug transport system ATPase subunit
VRLSKPGSSSVLISYAQMMYAGNQYGGGNSDMNVWSDTYVPMAEYTGKNYGTFASVTVNRGGQQSLVANMIHTALLRSAVTDPEEKRLASIATGFASVPIKTPYGSDNQSGALVSIIGTLLYSFATVFLFPSFVHAAVSEREERAYEMIRIMGVTLTKYWTAMYLFDMAVSTIVAVIVFIFALAAKIPPVGGSVDEHGSARPWAFLALLLCWNHALVCLALLFSSLFSKGRSALLVSYSFIILSVVGGVVMVSFSSTLSGAVNLFPPFAFISGIHTLLIGDSSSLSSLGSSGGSGSSGSAGSGSSSSLPVSVGPQCAALIGVGCLCALLAALISELGVSTSPLRRWLASLFSKDRRSSSSSSSSSSSASSSQYVRLNSSTKSKAAADYGAVSLAEPMLPSSGGGGEDSSAAGGDARQRPIAVGKDGSGGEDGEDVDVIEERARAEAGDPAAYNVCVRGLRKVFISEDGSEHVAVDGLSLAIPSGECMCLLGPNGAGKTTTFSMLHGTLRPTAGSAWIDGNDITEGLEGARASIGVVEQFDCHWSELSCEETLRFYARLAGVDPKSEQAVIQRTAEMVTLDGDSFKKASGSLSGGQKRLLSLGVASVHSPSVVLLDEPTTGLDTQMRRTAWKVIARLKQRSSCLVSTHSLPEAEALADRIAIMTLGRLACVGTSLHLKSRFGGGYLLTLAAANVEGAPAAIEAFVAQHAPTASLHKEVAGVYTYSIPRRSIRISAVFDEISRPENGWFIAEWSFSQASLDTVFHAIAEGHDDDHR